MNKNRILVESALLVALSVILTRFLSLKISIGGVEGVRIGIGVLPIIFAGLRFGAWQGGKVGALADIVGYLFSPGGAYIPVFTLTSALYGVLPPILFGKNKNNTKRLMWSVAVPYFILSVFVVPYFLYVFFGIHYMALFIPRFVSFVFNISIINIILVFISKKIEFLSVQSNLNT